VKQLAQQDYPRTSIVVLSDGSTDNTPIFAKYSYDQLPLPKQQDMIFLHNSNATGSLANLPQFLKEHCQTDSVVLMLEGSEALLDSNALKRVDEAFADEEVQVAHFQAFSSPHINVEASFKVEGEKLQPTLAPVLAFRSKLYQQLGQ
jgi:cellulose synthase/poly-beta-1,6-N-acetylglucosamine synthase-like glycosyltransferase